MGRYIISVDIEGISGVVGNAFANDRGKHYAEGKNYMLLDTNAVIKGIYNADKDAEVIVRDAHGSAVNLDLSKLDPRAKLIQGWGNNLNMLDGVESGVNAVFLVGYHAGGHNTNAVLAHTILSIVSSFKINGKMCNEAGLAGLYAGHYKVPVAFISGDDEAVKEAKEFFPHIVSVTVKESLARDSIVSFPLSKTQKDLEQNAEIATQEILHGKIKPYNIDGEINCELKLHSTGYSKSVYRSLVGFLSHDNSFQVVENECLIKFKVNSQIQAYDKLNTLILMIAGVRWFSKED